MVGNEDHYILVATFLSQRTSILIMQQGRSYTIAVIPGDGIGLEVMPPALRCLEAAAKRFGFQLEFRHYDWASCRYYNQHGTMVPDGWKELCQACDAIYFGAGAPQPRYSRNIEDLIAYPSPSSSGRSRHGARSHILVGEYPFISKRVRPVHQPASMPPNLRCHFPPCE